MKGPLLKKTNKNPSLAMGTAIYRSPKALCARNPQKVSKRVFPGRPARSVKKCRKSPRTLIVAPFDSFLGPLRLFRPFFDTPGREAREDLFETFWGFRAQRASGLLYMVVPIVIQAVLRGCNSGNAFSRTEASKSREFVLRGRKRGRRNSVTSDFFRFLPFFLRFFLFFFLFFFLVFFFSVAIFCCFFFGFRLFFSFFFPVSSFLSVDIFSFCFFCLSGSDFFFFFRLLPFFSVSLKKKKQKKTGRHRTRDPFCETPNLF